VRCQLPAEDLEGPVETSPKKENLLGHRPVPRPSGKEGDDESTASGHRRCILRVLAKDFGDDYQPARTGALKGATRMDGNVNASPARRMRPGRRPEDLF